MFSAEKPTWVPITEDRDLFLIRWELGRIEVPAGVDLHAARDEHGAIWVGAAVGTTSGYHQKVGAIFLAAGQRIPEGDFPLTGRNANPSPSLRREFHAAVRAGVLLAVELALLSEETKA